MKIFVNITEAASEDTIKAFKAAFFYLNKGHQYSFTKEEFLKGVSYPRTGYTFWKLIDGHKFYLVTDPVNTTKPAHKVFINAHVDYIQGHLRYGHYEGKIQIPDEEWELFKADPKAWIDEHDAIDDLELLVDDWSIAGVGDICDVNWREQ